MRLPSLDAFGVATGFAVAFLVNYAVSLVLGRPNTDPVVAASGAATLLVVTLAASKTGIAVWLAERRLNSVIMWGLGGVLVAVAAVVVLGPWPVDVVAVPALSMCAAVVSGAVAMLAANGAYARRLAETSARLGEWAAPPDTGYVRRTKWGLRAIGAVTLLLAFVAPFYHVNLTFAAGFGGALIGQSVAVGRTRNVEAYPEGIAITQNRSFGSQVFRWSQFDAVERTADALVFRRRLPVPVLGRFLSPRYALADLEDPDGVERLAREHVGH